MLALKHRYALGVLAAFFLIVAVGVTAVTDPSSLFGKEVIIMPLRQGAELSVVSSL